MKRLALKIFSRRRHYIISASAIAAPAPAARTDISYAILDRLRGCRRREDYADEVVDIRARIITTTWWRHSLLYFLLLRWAYFGAGFHRCRPPMRCWARSRPVNISFDDYLIWCALRCRPFHTMLAAAASPRRPRNARHFAYTLGCWGSEGQVLEYGLLWLATVSPLPGFLRLISRHGDLVMAAIPPP